MVTVISTALSLLRVVGIAALYLSAFILVALLNLYACEIALHLKGWMLQRGPPAHDTPPPFGFQYLQDGPASTVKQISRVSFPAALIWITAQQWHSLANERLGAVGIVASAVLFFGLLDIALFGAFVLGVWVCKLLPDDDARIDVVDEDPPPPPYEVATARPSSSPSEGCSQAGRAVQQEDRWWPRRLWRRARSSERG